MATSEQRRRLLAGPCPYCGAGTAELCSVARPARRDQEGGVRRIESRPITTLDGGCHDARWQAAGLGPAPVLPAAVQEIHARPARTDGPVPVMAGERPW